MIALPQLTVKERGELDELRELVGWKHLIEPIVISINLKESALLNFDFNRDEEGKIRQKSIFAYEETQKEIILLKEFLSFLETGGIIEEVKNYEVFETLDK